MDDSELMETDLGRIEPGLGFILFPLKWKIFFFFSRLSAFCRAAPAEYGDSQARGQIRAVTAGLRQSHNNAGSELRLRPTLQLTATTDP